MKKDSYIPPRQRFEFAERIRDEGIYIIELNHAQGYALVNLPVYCGSSYPLLPDYGDLSSEERKAIFEKQYDLDNIYEQRDFVLKLINEKRKEFGV